MKRDTPPRIVVGDRAQIRSDTTAYSGQFRGLIGDVVNLPWTCEPGSPPEKVCVLVQFAPGDVVLFLLSELSVIPNLDARRGEVV